MPAVPTVVGLSQTNAITALTGAGLVQGVITKVIANAPVDSVTRSNPSAGTQVAAGAVVDIDVSAGLWRRRWWENTSSLIFSSLAIISMIVIGSIFWSSFSHGDLLTSLGDDHNAKGLITFLIAFTTVAIAIIVAVSTVTLEDSPENDKRFDRGKQVLSILIGVLGTIVGYYYGASGASAPPTIKIASTALKTGTVGIKYEDTVQETGGKTPIKWTVTPALSDIGLALSDDGKITGNPQKDGTQKYEFTVTDADGKNAKASFDLKIEPAKKPGT